MLPRPTHSAAPAAPADSAGLEVLPTPAAFRRSNFEGSFDEDKVKRDGDGKFAPTEGSNGDEEGGDKGAAKTFDPSIGDKVQVQLNTTDGLQMVEGEVWKTRENPDTGERQYAVKYELGGQEGSRAFTYDNLQPTGDDVAAFEFDDGTSVSVSPEEIGAVKAYTTSAYGDINRSLRGLPASENAAPDAETQKQIEALDAAISRNKIGDGGVFGQSTSGEAPVFRGTRLSAFGVDSLDDLEEGMDLQNHAFASTSKEVSQAFDFAERSTQRNEGQGFIMKINTSSESTGLDVGHFSTAKGESEILLSRGSTFRVKAVHRDHPDGRRSGGRDSIPVVEVDHFDADGRANMRAELFFDEGKVKRDGDGKFAPTEGSSGVSSSSKDGSYGSVGVGDVMVLGPSTRAKVTGVTQQDDGKVKLDVEISGGDGKKRQSSITKSVDGDAPSISPKADTSPDYNAEEMGRDAAVSAIKDGVRAEALSGWFRNEDKNFKPDITDAINSDPKVRDAALNVMHDQLKNFTGEDSSFSEFMSTPITLYRGGGISDDDARDTFSSFTPDRGVAEGFGEDVTEVTLTPAETLGAMSTTGEFEILVPIDRAIEAKGNA